MKFTPTTPLKSLELPHLHLVLQEVFNIPINIPFMQKHLPQGFQMETMGDLCQFSNLKEETVYKRMANVLSWNDGVEQTYHDFLRISEKNSQSYLLLDLREREEFENFHLKESQLFTPDDFAEIIEDIKKHNKLALVICPNGLRSYSVAMYFRQQGYPSVYCLKGGIKKETEH